MDKKIQWGINFALLIILYRNTFPAWGMDLWTDDNYSHGMLIPLVALYFLNARLGELREAVSRPNFLGLGVLITGLLLFIVGNVGAELFTQRFSLIVVLAGLVLFLEGREVWAILRFPTAILFFAVPLPYILYNAVAFPLKMMASKVSVMFLKMIGMPVFRDGNIIQLAHTTLEVVDACSGIRSLMTLICLSFFLASLMHSNFFKQLLVFSLAIPVSVLANALRVALTGWLTTFDPAWGRGSLHDLSGWLVFVVSFVALAGLSYLLQSGADREYETGGEG